VTELTSDQQQRLAALRAALPPIVTEHERGLDVLEGGHGGRPLVIDCEWDRKTGELTLIGVGHDAVVVQIEWAGLDEYRRVEARMAIERLVQRVPIVYHHGVSDLKKLRAHTFDVHPATHFAIDDTVLAHAVLDAEEEHTLEYLVEKYGKLPQHKDLNELAPREYNAADVVETFLIWTRDLRPRLARDPSADSVYREMSIAYLCELQIEQEEAGIRVDKSVPYPMRDKYAAKIEQAERLAQAYVGWPLNLRSADDKKLWLYDVEAMPAQHKRAPRGKEKPVTIDKDAVAALRRLVGTEWEPDEEPTLEAAWAAIEAGGNPLLEATYLNMGAQQALSHYVMPCFETDAKGEIVGVRDRIYPEVRIHVQETGRHSYVGPALSQYRGELTKLITPDVGTVWVGHDWSNIETWLLGYLANDEVILEAKRGNWDTHTLNYCDITGTPKPPMLTKALHAAPECAAWRERLKWKGEDDDRRVFAKRFVYRLHYRGRPENAGDIPGARALGFDKTRLVDASQKYLARHPALVAYWQKIERQAAQYGIVYSFMGRPRRLTSPHPNARAREACNDPMQAGVADIYITTALKVRRAAPYARLVFGSYDSQWWQVPAEREAEFAEVYKVIVQRGFEINGQEASFPASFKRREAA
jgi:DNA polymerase I-like protein with 3'-5' exonuclease and polymerase domains